MKTASYELSTAALPRDDNRGIINNGFQVDTTSGLTDGRTVVPQPGNVRDEAQASKDVETTDSLDEMFCGVGSCRPSFAQCCMNMGCFSAFYSVIGLVSSALITYINSQITTLEKHFNLSSSMSGFLMSCNDLGYLATTLFMSYYTRRVHIPRALAASTILYGLSGLMCTLAFFATSDHLPSSFSNALAERNQSKLATPTPGNVQTCQNWTTPANSECQDTTKKSNLDIPENWRAFAISIIAVGMILQGIAKSPRQAFIITYVDDNVEKTKTAMYLGIITGMSIFGPAMAYALGGVFSSIYITLEETNLSPRDPRWLGAWWLGFLVFGGAGVIVGLPLIFFPKRMRAQNPQSVAKEKKSEEAMKSEAKLWHDFKDLLKAVLRLARNPVFMCLTLGHSINMLSVSGSMAFLPKYMETQFSLTASTANIYIGATQFIAAPIGTIVGGLLTSRLKWSPKTCLQLMITLTVVSTVVTALGFVLGCDQPVVLTGAGEERSGMRPVSKCVEDCHCDSGTYFPICGQDGNSYFSPCHAGCSFVDNKIFTNCSCLASSRNQTATGGLCVQDCGFFYPFLAVYFIAAFVACIGLMPGFIAYVRSVKDEDKPLAVALNAFSGTLLGWLPGPVITGALVDSTCMLWKTTCSATGACALYNIELFRFRFHFLTIGLRGVIIGLYLIALAFVVFSKLAVYQSHQDISVDPAKEQIKELADCDAKSESQKQNSEIKLSKPKSH